MRSPTWLTARPVAHRGLHDNAQGIIENMPSAIKAAIAANFSIEVDLQLTADGEAMVHHDDVLGRLNEGTGTLRSKTAAELRQVPFKGTFETMMTLPDLCALVAGRVPLIIELKSHFDHDRRLAERLAEVLAAYSGPVAAMSFDPHYVQIVRELIPRLPRGITAEYSYSETSWPKASDEQRRGMTHLRHALRTEPNFIAYRVDDLPSAAPWIARNIFGCALLAWTVRTSKQRAKAGRYADQMIFENFRPDL